VDIIAAYEQALRDYDSRRAVIDTEIARISGELAGLTAEEPAMSEDECQQILEVYRYLTGEIAKLLPRQSQLDVRVGRAAGVLEELARQEALLREELAKGGPTEEECAAAVSRRGELDGRAAARGAVVGRLGELRRQLDADVKRLESVDRQLAEAEATIAWRNVIEKARGYLHIVFHDTSGLGAGGFTVTLAGGTAVTGGGVPLTGGSGTEDVSNLLTTLTPGLYELIGASTNDTTNLGRWKTYLNAKAAATEGRLESLVFATNGSLVSTATAISTSTTNCNFTRFNHLWMPNSEGHPSRIAAVFAADRSVTEQSNPSPRYMNEPLPGIPVYSQLADVPTTSIADTALNNGVTPIGLRNGAATVIRGITTYCLNGSQPDDRALDISNQSMSDYAYKSFAQIWNDDISVNFLYVIDEPDLESGAEVSGLAIYPSLWNNILIEQLRLWEKRGWVYDVSNHLPETIYDSSTKRLLFNCPVYATPGLYQIGGNIRQVAS
jgi:hypothetical protein